MQSSEQASIILGIIGKAISEIPSADLNKLMQGTHTIELKVIKARTTQKLAAESIGFDPVGAARKLDDFSDRVTAGQYLLGIAPNRKHLEILARHLEIALSKQDKAEDLVRKIIEATVGARLRSSAIRGGDT